MKLLTLNCHSWKEEHQLDKIVHLANTIIGNSYDVIALQEVSQAIAEEYVDGKVKKNNYGYVLLQELKKLGNEEYSFVWDVTHYVNNGTYEEGIAILTKHPVLKQHSFYVSQSEDYAGNWKTRRTVGATILYEEKPYTFYSCHMGWWHDEEEPFKVQVDKLLKEMNWDEQFFLMGDFNNDAALKGEGYEYLLSHGLYDTYHLAKEKDEGTTVKGKIKGWNDNEHDLRIDLILSNKPVETYFSNVIFNNTNKLIVSDHFGVEVKVHL
ncbi:endonuclease/exonuclease/phosphatase family protein [Neobacillus cucumis]|uniref:endonuclease/exonuclease/phosphatase family protein n=1 Tax=Neobacillus cucumis TaxID=1740721 RepID=UPI002E22D602|nr:endonuclease/exonuclease/phosphatase family protein [Neobacillus cucumis]